MKKFIFIVLLTLCSLHIKAQEQSKHEQIKALRVAYFTEKLDLSKNEAQFFWPVYNEYDEKVHELRHNDFKNILKEMRQKGLDNYSDAEANATLDKIMEIDKEIFEERVKLIKNLKQGLSAKKIIMLKKVEDDFYRELIAKLRKKGK
ncbi:hypothetical protein ACG2LH_08975 [Zhouia sp. PK063]|uniref:hypothetical protein n=1 Tax=Zhouia sp. PK063 TaxID=3373602 RepID=UPI0037BA12B6